MKVSVRASNTRVNCAHSCCMIVLLVTSEKTLKPSAWRVEQSVEVVKQFPLRDKSSLAIWQPSDIVRMSLQNWVARSADWMSVVFAWSLTSKRAVNLKLCFRIAIWHRSETPYAKKSLNVYQLMTCRDICTENTCIVLWFVILTELRSNESLDPSYRDWAVDISYTCENLEIRRTTRTPPSTVPSRFNEWDAKTTVEYHVLTASTCPHELCLIVSDSFSIFPQWSELNYLVGIKLVPNYAGTIEVDFAAISIICVYARQAICSARIVSL
jgi:hypothetical protein